MLANEPGRHHVHAVGPFATAAECTAWADENKLRADRPRPLIAPDGYDGHGYVVATRVPDTNGYEVVGEFASKDAVNAWLREQGREGIAYPLVAPHEWQRNDGSMDDGPKEFES